jgi:hypothetical protein
MPTVGPFEAQACAVAALPGARESLRDAVPGLVHRRSLLTDLKDRRIRSPPPSSAWPCGRLAVPEWEVGLPPALRAMSHRARRSARCDIVRMRVAAATEPAPITPEPARAYAT